MKETTEKWLKNGILCLTLLCCCLMVKAQEKKKKTVFVIVDGIPADVIEKVKTPYLDQIAQVGGYTRAYMGGEKGTYSETPTISAVGYNSLLTGTWVHKHNVWDNDIEDPNYHYWSIFRFLEEQYPEKKTAIFSTWLDNRTKLIGEALPETGDIRLDYHFDGFELDTVRFPHDEDRKFIQLIDEHVVAEAAGYIRKEAPDLSWVYLEYTDDMGHRYGDSKRMYKAVEGADKQIGQLWDAIQYRQQNYPEEWLIVITTDHGRDAKTGKDHGGQSDRERTIWITTNAAGLNNYFRQDQPGMVDIMPTIARFMDIRIPKAQAMEIDGVPLIGPVSISQANIQYEQEKIQLRWKSLEKQGKVKIWLSATNDFKELGRIDEYLFIGEVPILQEQYTIDVKSMPSSFYKVVLEGPHNLLNKWVVLEKK